MNIQQYVFDNVSEMILKSNDKFCCIEDQFWIVDRFPVYEHDGIRVFKCYAEECGCLIQTDCLTECDECFTNFCDFKHTQKSVCKKKHDCAKKYLFRAYHKRNEAYGLVCKECLKRPTVRDKYIVDSV